MADFRLSAALVLLACLTVPLHAQETDTTASDAPSPTPDTTEGLSSDSVRADTTDTLATDRAAADTLSPQEIRARIEKRARAAAESWLALTDAGNFGESWDAAAPSLQHAIAREQWITNGEAARSRLDELQERTLTRVIHPDSLPTPRAQPDTALLPPDSLVRAADSLSPPADSIAPPADSAMALGPDSTAHRNAPLVVGLQYWSRFANETVLEAVITTRIDTTWRVAGYRVVQAPDEAHPDSTGTRTPPEP